MASGAFCLVLHGHLPWVLHHGRWPHGEDWLYEAASETWLPLLEVLDLLADEDIQPGWTVGLMPILLEQLACERFRSGLPIWLEERAGRAAADAVAFESQGEMHLAHLARRYEDRFGELAAGFEARGRDLAGALLGHADAGRITLLTSNATHAFHPLVLHDACARAQVRAGIATSERHFGHRPQGAWLPECAYRPPGPWTPSAVHGDERNRQGVASLFASEGIGFFFVDTHLVTGARAVALVDGETSQAVTPDQADWDTVHAWCSELEPHRIVEGGTLTDLTVLARCPDVSEQVWSGQIGYPGDGRYLEFHKRHGLRGLRYWKVTGRALGLGEKHLYYPDDVSGAVAEHARHFVELVKRRLYLHEQATGRYGVVCAPFDAELFGHWWHEGPDFLLEVARRLDADPHVDACTVPDFLRRVPADKSVELPEGSWGAGGDHRVWLNEGLKGYWEAAYRAEDRFLDLWHRAPWRDDHRVAELLTEAGRQLLLLQASDWPFVVSTGGAVDYGMRRVFDHAARLDDLCNGIEDLLSRPDDAPDEVVTATLTRCRLLEPIFPDLDLAWWT